MIIGRFAEQADGTIIGHVRCLFLRSDKVVFEPIADTGKSEKSPAFRIWTSDEIELGAAWGKSSKDGVVYYEVKIDDPTLAQPIYARLVQPKGKSGFILVWERTTRRKAA